MQPTSIEDTSYQSNSSSSGQQLVFEHTTAAKLNSLPVIRRHNESFYFFPHPIRTAD